MELVVFVAAARVQHDRAGLAAHAHELLFGDAPRLAVLRRLARHLEISRHVDGWVRMRKSRDEAERCDPPFHGASLPPARMMSCAKL
jgi:ribosomal protein L39E